MTKKFEEEYNHWFDEDKRWTDSVKKHFKNWHSDEEFQELSEKLDDTIDALDIARNSRDEFEREYKKLKFQLQQQVLPVIPDYVAQLVDYTVKVQHTIPSDIIGYFYFRNEQFSIEDMNLPNDILDLEKLSEYFKIGLHILMD